MGCPNCHPSPLSNCATVPMTHKYQCRSTGTVWAFHIVHSRYNGAVASTDERQVWIFTHYRSTCTVYAILVVRSRYIGECAKYRWILPSPYKCREIYHWSHQWSTSHRVGWNLETNGVNHNILNLDTFDHIPGVKTLRLNRDPFGNSVIYFGKEIHPWNSVIWLQAAQSIWSHWRLYRER